MVQQGSPPPMSHDPLFLFKTSISLVWNLYFNLETDQLTDHFVGSCLAWVVSSFWDHPHFFLGHLIHGLFLWLYSFLGSSSFLKSSSFWGHHHFWGCLQFWGRLHFWDYLHFWDCLHFWGRLHFWDCLHFWDPLNFWGGFHFWGCPFFQYEQAQMHLKYKKVKAPIF